MVDKDNKWLEYLMSADKEKSKKKKKVKIPNWKVSKRQRRVVNGD